MIRAELRSDGDRCYGCSAPLSDATVLSRSWCKIRSGEWIGDRGEYATLQCRCGQKVRLLWAVNMAPRHEQAA